MEFLQGESLASRMQGGPLSVREAVEIALPVCEALGRAHALGVVHRDVKPENVFLSRDASGMLRVKVLDFGIVHMRSEARLTMPGEVFGTPEYLASELARGEPCGPASDLYALGVLLFEMVAGELPFTGGIQTLIEHHARSQAPSLRSRIAVPDALDALVSALMHKSPAERPRSALEVLDALRGVLAREGTVLAPAGRSSTPDARYASEADTGDGDPDSEPTLRTLSRVSEARAVSVSALRQQCAALDAAAEAAFADGVAATLRERLRTLRANVDRLRDLDDARRGWGTEIARREVAVQREREELLADLRVIAVEREGILARSDAPARSVTADDETQALQDLALAWQSAGSVPRDLAALTDARAQQLEDLGRLASRWRALRASRDGAVRTAAARQRAVDDLDVKRRETEAALVAVGDGERAAAQRLHREAVVLGREIAALVDTVEVDLAEVRLGLERHAPARALLHGTDGSAVAVH